MAAKIQLFTSGGASVTRKIDDPNVSEDGQFTSAKVDKGQWITYNSRNYNPSTWGPDSSQILEEGEGTEQLKFSPASLRVVRTFASEGVTVYKHNDYCGPKLECYSQNPSFDIGGVSSMIISGGRWKLYIKPNFDGAAIVQGPGVYPNPQTMGIPNNTLASIEKMS